MIEIKNLTKKYGSKEALSDVSLQIPQGQIVGLFGENGAGKTTLMQCILKYLNYSGTITLDGQPIDKHNIARISYATSEHSFFPNLSAKGHKEFYEMYFPTFKSKRFEALMDFFELDTKRPMKRFSVGQQNQFEVILALSQGADYILMDEPFSGNDVFNRADFYKVLLGILEPNETVLLSTHLLEEVDQFIGRALLLHKGKLIADKDMQELEDEGKTLMSFVSDAYGYKQDRINKILNDLDE